MSTRIKADGHTWRATLAEEGEEQVVIFFCTSSDQRPYRVVRVAADRYAGRGGFDETPDEELRALFDASRSMGIPQDYPAYSP